MVEMVEVGSLSFVQFDHGSEKVSEFDTVSLLHGVEKFFEEISADDEVVKVVDLLHIGESGEFEDGETKREDVAFFFVALRVISAKFEFLELLRGQVALIGLFGKELPVVGEGLALNEVFGDLEFANGR